MIDNATLNGQYDDISNKAKALVGAIHTSKDLFGTPEQVPPMALIHLSEAMRRIEDAMNRVSNVFSMLSQRTEENVIELAKRQGTLPQEV